MSREVVAGESLAPSRATQRSYQPPMSSPTHGGPTEQHRSNPATAILPGGDSTANLPQPNSLHASANSDASSLQREILAARMAATQIAIDEATWAEQQWRLRRKADSDGGRSSSSDLNCHKRSLAEYLTGSKNSNVARSNRRYSVTVMAHRVSRSHRTYLMYQCEEL
jgi:hypothetical protein